MNEKKYVYVVYDEYEGEHEELGRTTNFEDAKKLAVERAFDTDGECAVMYHAYNAATGEFIMRDWMWVDMEEAEVFENPWQLRGEPNPLESEEQ